MHNSLNPDEFAQALSDHRPESINIDPETVASVEYLNSSKGEVAKIDMSGANTRAFKAVLEGGHAGTLAYFLIDLPTPNEPEDPEDEDHA